MGLWNGHLGAYNGVWHRGVDDIPSPTKACSCLPPVSAPASLPLPGAAQAWR
jgi:hypothetical protein